MCFKKQTPYLCRGRWLYLWGIRLIHLALFLASVVSAFLLRFEFSIPSQMKAALWACIWVGLGVKTTVFQLSGLGRGLWRYFSMQDVVRLTVANVLASTLSAIILTTAGPRPFPRSVLVIDLALTLLLTGGARAGTRLILEISTRTQGILQKRTLIYGAGAAGSMLLREARSNGKFNHLICGFIDDDASKRQMMLNGVPVRGAGADLPKLAAEHSIQEVLIAVPSATGPQVEKIIEHCHRAGVEFRTVPSISDLLTNRRTVSQIREVAVEDVLGRSAVQLNQEEVSRKLRGRTILVTGAAGSIGSELCRQIACFEPADLVALDMSETAVFHLEREILQRASQVRFHAEIGNIQNRQRLRDVFGAYRPSVVYHAAAYKHVPLMEAHAFEAIENNVFGTYHLATVAAEFGAEDFVMISSDKAVNPTNIMGATKRVAELLICSLQNGGPRFVSVRFGNVLGSNGSVVPIFQKQIASGGPVTITHPEMRRYFMTIPEASQLVLQASTMGRGGEVFVLDMGQPVRIVDLARQLIRLSGLRPDKDIRIAYTGLRPGEKLCEELNLAEERAVATRHQKIKAFAGLSLPFEQVIRHLATLRAACEARDLRKLILELRSMVPDYSPSPEMIQDLSECGLSRLAEVTGRDAGMAPAGPDCSPVSQLRASC